MSVYLDRLRYMSAAVVDQVVYSGGNVLLVSQISRASDGPSLAAASSAYASVQIVILVIRSGVTEVFLSTRRTYDGGAGLNPVARTIIGVLALAVAGISVLVLFCFGFGPATLLIGGLPLLLIQDRVRFEWIQQGRPSRALRVDVAWLGAQLLVLVALGSVLSPSANDAVLAWLIGAAFCLAFAQPGRLAPLAASWRWLVENRFAVSATTAQSLVISSTIQVPVFIFSLVHHPAAAAGYLAANSMLAPQVALLAALRPLILRSVALDTGSVRRGIQKIVLLVVCPSFVAALVGIGLVYWFGDAIYGEAVADSARTMSWWVAVAKGVGPLSVAFIGYIRAYDRWGLTIVGEVATALLMGLPPAGIAVAFRSPGAVAAAQTGGAIMSVLLWAHLCSRATSGEGRHG